MLSRGIYHLLIAIFRKNDCILILQSLEGRTLELFAAFLVSASFNFILIYDANIVFHRWPCLNPRISRARRLFGPGGRVVMQRFAKPCTSVQFRSGPPKFNDKSQDSFTCEGVFKNRHRGYHISKLLSKHRTSITGGWCRRTNMLGWANQSA